MVEHFQTYTESLSGSARPLGPNFLAGVRVGFFSPSYTVNASFIFDWRNNDDLGVRNIKFCAAVRHTNASSHGRIYRGYTVTAKLSAGMAHYDIVSTDSFTSQKLNESSQKYAFQGSK